jgi:hypothetical protein
MFQKKSVAKTEFGHNPSGQNRGLTVYTIPLLDETEKLC